MDISGNIVNGGGYVRKDKTTLCSTFSVNKEFSDEDTRFLHVTVDVLHTGKNLNNSFFDKEVVNTYVDSIKNIPILGFIRYDEMSQENDFSGHEYKITRTSNGIEEVYIGRAYGLVPESCNPRWITKMCYDGFEREFLQIDAIMWERFSDATNIVDRDYEKRQSMELQVDSVDGYDDENGVFHFTKFFFDGLCLLGDHIQEAMIGANVRINDGVNFSMSDISDTIRSELNDKLEKFNVAFAQFTNGEICGDQGGAKDMLNTELNQVDEKVEDAAEFEAVETEAELEVEVEVETEVEETEVETDADFEAEVDTVEAGVEAIVDEAEAEFEAVESEDVVETEVEATVEEVFEQETAETEVDEAEVVADEPNFSEMQAEIDSLKADLASVRAEHDEMISSFEKLKTDYDSIKSEYDEIKPKYDEYVQAEAQRVAEELSAQKDAAFAEYESDLSENAEFSALKEKKDEMSLEDIEKECAFLYVKVNRSKNKFSAAEPQSAVVGVLDESEDSEKDGLVLTKYGYIPVSR